MKFRNALPNDLKSIEGMLQQSNLPHSDCEQHLNNFLIIEDKKDIMGIGGLEPHGEIGLLRSIVVKKKFQEQGVGQALCFELINRARSLGIRELYLLTNTAEGYFKQHGFVTINREDATESIKQTKQFSGLCPTSATLMKRVLD